MKTPTSLVFVVVGTMALMALTYVLTIAYCICAGITPNETLTGIFKDAGIFILGALTSILNNTRSAESSPVETRITNTPKDPVPTTPIQD